MIDFWNVIHGGAMPIIKTDTPSNYVRNEGLPSLSYVCKKTDVSYQTLTNWYVNKNKLFRVVVEGCKHGKKV